MKLTGKVRKYGTVFCVVAIFATSVYAQEELSVFDYWKFYEGTPSMSLYKHLYERASDQLGKRQKVVAMLRTKTDWQKRQSWVRQKLAESIGKFTDKTPLNPVVTGTIDRSDFRVEKLYFESQPGYFVTAALFIPKNKPGKRPAILYCSGHSANGFRSDVYQHAILNYVKKGFVVLAFDPIGQGERRQYLDMPDKSSPTRDHSYSGTHTFVAGLSPAYYFVWDGIRSIDYLLTRPEVDAARIGITGRSGGGTQTAYLAALDDRILAAAPECFITTTDKLWQSNGPQDSEQNLVGFLYKELDFPDLIEVRAPKPTLLISTTRDMFPIQGVRDTYQEAQAAFRAFGKPDQLTKVEDDAPHASTPKNREAAYAFFQKYLENPGSPEDLKVDIFKEEELYATPGGDVFQALNSESLFSLNQKYTQAMVQKRRTLQNGKILDLNKVRDRAMALSGYEKPTGNKEVVFSGRLQRPGYALEKYLVKGAGNYYLPVLWLKPPKTIGSPILLLDDRGKASAVGPGALADLLVNAGHEVIVPDLSGVGELGPGYMNGGDAVLDNVPLNVWYAGIQTHKSIVAIRAEEIAILTDFIQKTSVASLPLSVTAIGTLTSDVLHAAVFTNPFERIILLNPLVAYQSITEKRHYQTKFALSAVAGALESYDLPELVAVLPSNKVLLINPVDATGTEVDQQTLNTLYSNTLKSHSSKTLKILNAVKPRDIETTILNWVY